MKHVKQFGRKRRHLHIRERVKGTSERPRLVIFRSNRHIYAQIVNDEENRVITGFSSQSQAFKNMNVEGDKKADSRAVGKLLAKALKERGISRIVFDRAGYRYHGRVKALAEAAREEGLEF
ncbi:50S ribosomal protein L18 [bacterium]|nr:50S ribosomal protein L18 [bacterium]